MKRIITAAMMTVSVMCANATTDRLVEQIIETSPQAEALKSKLRAETVNSLTTNNLDDPEVEFEHQWGMKGIGNKWGVSVSQDFDWPGTYSARSRAAKLMRKASQSSFDSELNELRLRVKLSLIDLCHANRDAALLDSIKSSLTQLLDKYRTSFDKGETTILDVKKIEIELLGVTRQLNEAIITREGIVGELRSINPGFSWENTLTLNQYPVEEGILTEAEYAEMLRLNDNRSRYLNDMKELSIANAKVEHNSGMPGFAVGYRYDYELGERFNGLSVGITLPLFSNRNKVKAAMAEADSYQATLMSRNAALEAEWNAMRQQAIRLGEECEQYKRILTTSDTQRLLKMALDGGEISLLNYLQETAYFKQAQRDYIATEHDLHTVLAKLNRYIPTDI